MIKKLFITIIIITLIIITSVHSYIISRPSYKIKKYFYKREFKLNKNIGMYYKQISQSSQDTYESNKNKGIADTTYYLYFGESSYHLYEKQQEFDGEIEDIYNGEYDYKTNKITYNYRIYYNNTNILFNGSYNGNTDKFKCNKMLSYGISLSNTDNNDICELIKYNTKYFYLTAKDTIKSDRILNYIKNTSKT